MVSFQQLLFECFKRQYLIAYIYILKGIKCIFFVFEHTKLDFKFKIGLLFSLVCIFTHLRVGNNAFFRSNVCRHDTGL